MKIHEDDCPALKDWTYAYGYTMAQELGQFKRAPHPCTCTAEAKLRELVEAAERAILFLGGNPLRGPGPEGLVVQEGLCAALEPFRERPGEKEAK